MNSTDQYYDYLVKHINSVYKCYEILTGVKTKEVTVDDLKKVLYATDDKVRLSAITLVFNIVSIPPSCLTILF